MLKDLIDVDIAVLVHLTICKMLEYEENDRRKKIYREIADKLLDEMKVNKRAQHWIEKLTEEYELTKKNYIRE